MASPPRQLALLAVLASAAAWAWAAAAAQPTTAEAAPDNPPGVGIKVSFRPSVAIVVGIFTMIFSLTFLLLMYAKFCHPSSPANPPTTAAVPSPGPGTISSSSNNNNEGGVPKPVIESLPFFRFATLRGSRQGMECSVCLARFDDADLLRLLPRCRHAFHLACVDRWLESSASCPLCRTRVDADAAALGLKYPSSARIVFGGDAALSSGRFDDTAGSGRDLLDIFVERVPGAGAGAGPEGADDPKSSKQEQEQAQPSPSPELDRHKHRIIVSDVVFKSRWSELNSDALLALDTEMMLRSTSSGRFYPDSPASPEYDGASKLPAAAETTTRREVERKRLLGTSGDAVVEYGRGGGCSSSAAVDAASSASAAARMISSGVRSMSEIVSLPRLRRERLSEEENQYRRWLPIARRTARWFAGRSRGEEEEEQGQGQGAAVHVVAAHV